MKHPAPLNLDMGIETFCGKRTLLTNFRTRTTTRIMIDLFLVVVLVLKPRYKMVQGETSKKERQYIDMTKLIEEREEYIEKIMDREQEIKLAETSQEKWTAITKICKESRINSKTEKPQKKCDSKEIIKLSEKQKKLRDKINSSRNSRQEHHEKRKKHRDEYRKPSNWPPHRNSHHPRTKSF